MLKCIGNQLATPFWGKHGGSVWVLASELCSHSSFVNSRLLDNSRCCDVLLRSLFRTEELTSSSSCMCCRLHPAGFHGSKKSWPSYSSLAQLLRAITALELPFEVNWGFSETALKPILLSSLPLQILILRIFCNFSGNKSPSQHLPPRNPKFNASDLL